MGCSTIFIRNPDIKKSERIVRVRDGFQLSSIFLKVMSTVPVVSCGRYNSGPSAPESVGIRSAGTLISEGHPA